MTSTSKTLINALATIFASVAAMIILTGILVLALTSMGSRPPRALTADGSAAAAPAPQAPGPSVVLGQPRLKVSADRFTAKASWGAEIENKSGANSLVSLEAQLLDKDGLPVAQDYVLPTVIGPGKHDLTSIRHLSRADAEQIVSIRVNLNVH